MKILDTKGYIGKIRNIHLLIESLNNWYEVPLVYCGLKRKAIAKFKGSDARIPIHKGSNDCWWKMIALTRLRRSVELYREDDRYRVFIRELKELSPPLSLDELCFQHYYVIHNLLRLIQCGASYADGILTLDFFSGSPSFKIDLWSDMPSVLHLMYYERFCDRLLPDGVKDKVVVDIGAYIGDTAIYFAIAGASRVIAFEPHPLLYNMLLESIKLNNLHSRIEARNVAVGGAFGKVELRMPLDVYRDWGHAAVSMFSGGKVVAEVPIVPLDRALTDLDEVDVVKMNCEGGEFPAIIGADESVLRKVSTFVIQVHEPYGNRADLINKLRRVGFSVVHVSGEFYRATKT